MDLWFEHQSDCARDDELKAMELGVAIAAVLDPESFASL